MPKHKLHLHSMMVHSVIALALIAAIAYIFFKLQISFYTFGQETWYFLTAFSFIAMLLVVVPSIMSGVFERGHMYAKWHSTHKIKMIMSVVLAIALLIELGLFLQSSFEGALFSLLGILIIFVNNILTLMLGGYGLKISLGRQSLGKLSYTPDLFKKEPIDILVSAGEHKKEEPKYVDLLTER